MTGNDYLERLSKYNDENFALNTLLNDLTLLSDKFIKYIGDNVPNLDKITEEERVFLTKVTCLIGYFFVKNDIEVPVWITDDRLVLSNPCVFGSRHRDSWYFKTISNAPPIFKAKNVYFDLSALIRI